MTSGSRARHAKPKRRPRPLLLAAVVLVAVLAAAVIWWVKAPVAQTTSTPTPSATATKPKPSPTPTPTPTPTPPASIGPTKLTALAGTNISGEGVWSPALRTARGPILAVTWLRTLAVGTPRAAIAWLDQSQVRFELRPGTSEPGVPAGSTWSPWLPPTERDRLVAAVNGGFRLKDSFGGFYLFGRTVRPLRTGSSSAVIYLDGHMDIGVWGKEVRLTPQVVSVRQELYPLIDNGVPSPVLKDRPILRWGGVVGGAVNTWRSGIGVTASGALLYACGPNMAPVDLAAVLLQAGAVRAMELDINPYWVSFMWFGHATSGLVAHKLIDFNQSADRYLKGPSARDFFAVYLK